MLDFSFVLLLLCTCDKEEESFLFLRFIELVADIAFQIDYRWERDKCLLFDSEQVCSDVDTKDAFPLDAGRNTASVPAVDRTLLCSFQVD